MTNPLIHAFFVGRATAEVLSETVEHRISDLLSEVGKFDAEQRDRMHLFVADVMERAQFQEERTAQGRSTATEQPTTEGLQETVDELRAEIAQLRATLHSYRNPV
ncbi:hypothetical protein GS597_18785 [Synechococcales cyanobacterium C]|uniref:Thylakoid lumen protein n=1 Tax=Petrachloros mirabilis ULC683 TaxID=2781853 RepID=A0A8K2A2E3_9CYAN|nr:hypothetical protein [Petrachloros mirabilis]NCJ08516.1 hypothetical protein [Petrachloros mirabilis ULC683]